MKISLILIFLITGLFVYAEKIDSLLRVLPMTDDSLKHSLYLEVLKEINSDSLSKLIEYAELADLYANDNLSKEKYADFLNIIGLVFYQKSNFILAQKYFDYSLTVYKEISDELNIAKMLSNIAVTYELTSNYEEAINYYNSALETFQKIEYYEGCSKIYNNLGVLYQEMGLYEQSIGYFKKSLSLKLKLEDYQTLATTYNNIGVSFEEQKDNPDSALFYYNKALSIFDSLGNELNYAITLQNIAAIYSAENEFEKALNLYFEIEKIFLQLSNKQGLAWVYRNIADSYLRSNQVQKVDEFLTKSRTIAIEIKDFKTYLELSKLYADYYYKINKYDSAIIYLYEYIQMKDSLIGIENQQRIDELNKKYQTKILEYQINELDNQNQLKNEKLKKNNILIAFLSLSLIFGLIVFVVIRKFLKNKAEMQRIELNQKIMRLQMNPHFISNSLVTAQNFILENRAVEASDYLSDFSSLMRLSIKATASDFISLEDELEIVEKFLKIQQRRNQNLFDYQINIDKNIETEFINFPPMILQPFVENCIKHAFKEIDYKGLILINLNQNNDNLVIEIIDNGVGYKPDYKSNSYSISINKERLNIISKKYKKQASIEISGNNNQGTKVKITLPADL